jgi:hypothetical protein
MSEFAATNWTPEAFESPEEAAIQPLTVWSPSQFLSWQEPPGSHFLLPAYVSRGQLTTIIGQGGLGKSRLAGLWLPVCQITGREWCGLQTGGDPQKWLVLGDENSLSRIKADLEKILSNLTDEERTRVEKLLRIQAICSFEDADLNLGDITTRVRIRKTIAAERPGGVIIDPLGNFAPGDIAKPHDMKEAVRLVTATVRAGAPEAAVVSLHHARTGRTNIAQGVGWDAANFATGGKTLFAAARCQINLMPGDPDDDTRLVLSCAKANNCERFATRGLIFEPVGFTYKVDPDFDVDRWQAEVEGRARAGQSLCTVADVVAAVSEGYTRTKELVAHLTEACAVSKPTVERLIRSAVKKQGIKAITRGKFMLGKKYALYSETTT